LERISREARGDAGMAIRKFRYIEPGHGRDSLTTHEKEEISRDFDIEIDELYVLTALTEEEWKAVLEVNRKTEEVLAKIDKKLDDVEARLRKEGKWND
jgi:hypothetical protein